MRITNNFLRDRESKPQILESKMSFLFINSMNNTPSIQKCGHVQMLVPTLNTDKKDIGINIVNIRSFAIKSDIYHSRTVKNIYKLNPNLRNI